MFGKLRLLSHYAVHCIIVSVGILTFNFLSLPSVLGLLHISNSTSSTSDRRVPRPFACSLEVFLFCKFENAGNKRIEIRMPLQFRLKPPRGTKQKSNCRKKRNPGGLFLFLLLFSRGAKKSHIQVWRSRVWRDATTATFRSLAAASGLEQPGGKRDGKGVKNSCNRPIPKGKEEGGGETFGQVFPGDRENGGGRCPLIFRVWDDAYFTSSHLYPASVPSGCREEMGCAEIF